jgi:hypothetical protein
MWGAMGQGRTANYKDAEEAAVAQGSVKRVRPSGRGDERCEYKALLTRAVVGLAKDLLYGDTSVLRF